MIRLLTPTQTQYRQTQTPTSALNLTKGGTSANQVRFGNTDRLFIMPKPRKLLEHLDFTDIGASPVKQIGVIFSALIIWRLLAANERRRASVSKRWNELRENLMRDLLGFAFWFLGVPVLQRLYLGMVAKRNPKLQHILIQRTHMETKGKGVLGWIKANNPLTNRYIPSSQQVKDWMEQALLELKVDKTHPVYQQTQKEFLRFIKHRNLATALGLGSTILLLGVGINLLNFYLTRKNVTRELNAQAAPTGTNAAQNPFLNSRPATFPSASVNFRPIMPSPYPSIQSAPYQPYPGYGPVPTRPQVQQTPPSPWSIGSI